MKLNKQKEQAVKAYIKRALSWGLSLSLVLGLGLASCQREDLAFPIPEPWEGVSFSLSEDSIKLDTLPSEYLSASYNIRLYNPQKRSLRFKEIKLKNGQKLGFSLNIDGRASEEVQGLSLPARDSLYIFVRAFLPLGEEDSPTAVKDQLLITEENGASISIPIIAIRQNVEHIHSKIIKQDLEYHSARPWLVHDSLVVERGVRLSLKAPAQIWFRDKAYMRVKGKLEVRGTEQRAVRFCGTRWDKFLPLIPYNRLPAQWGGVYFSDGGQADLERLELLNSSFGLDFSALETKDNNKLIAQLKHCRLHNIKGIGIQATSGSYRLIGTEVSNCLGSCLDLSGGDYQIKDCSLINYYPWSAIRQGETLVYRDERPTEKPKAMQELTTSKLHITGSIIDGSRIALQDHQGKWKGGELSLIIQHKESDIHISQSFLNASPSPRLSQGDNQGNIFRDPKTKAETLYERFGKNEEGKDDYLFDFRPKADSPLKGFGAH